MSKFKSKFFRVAVEGATTDGRKIDRKWIEEMAASYNRTTYGARIWLEHLRGTLPEGPFKAYGDVLAAKAEEVDIDGKKRLALYVQIDPTQELVTMNKARQKIYTSIELLENFADTGKAYLLGLGITDSPASLGTDVLEFSAKNPEVSPFKSRKQNPDSLFTEALEVEFDFEEVASTDPSKAEGLLFRVKEIMGLHKDKAGKDATLFNELGESVEAIAQHLADQDKNYTQIKADLDSLRKDYKGTSEQLETLQKTLSDEPGNSYTQRPPAAGGSGQKLATF